MTDTCVPFIAKFQTDKNYYLYDVNSNHFLRVEPIFYDAISYFGLIPPSEIQNKLSSKYPLEKISSALSKIAQLQKEAKLLLSYHPRQLAFPLSREQIEHKINGELSQLILEVTDRCNLRCKYCIYSGDYAFNRKHGYAVMDSATAKKAVDYFSKHTTATNEPSISFYGGEPLIAFALLKSIANYLRYTFPRTFHLNLTTNATLLTEEITDFLVENDFSLLISLDGPKEIHDKMRIYRNGQGTYNRIVKNLMALRSRHPNYYKDKVNFHVTISMPSRLESVIEYYESGDDLFTDKPISVEFVSFLDRGTNGIPIEPMNQKEQSKLEKQFTNLVLLQRTLSPFFRGLYQRTLYTIHRRRIMPLNDTIYPNGICCPGTRRLFCTINGDFTFCERVNPGFFLGNVDIGINVDLVWKAITDYIEMSTDDCVNCWAVRFCKLCFTSILGNHFDIERKRKACQAVKNELLNVMRLYASMREVDDNVFDAILKDVEYF
jgi:uncharacterized protein